MNGRIIIVSAGDAHATTSSIISLPSLLESGYQEPLDILKYANGKPLGADDPLIDDVEPIYKGYHLKLEINILNPSAFFWLIFEDNQCSALQRFVYG